MSERATPVAVALTRTLAAGERALLRAAARMLRRSSPGIYGVASMGEIVLDRVTGDR